MTIEMTKRHGAYRCMEWGSMEVSVRDELKVRALKLDKKKRKECVANRGLGQERKDKDQTKSVRVSERERERKRKRKRGKEREYKKSDVDILHTHPRTYTKAALLWRDWVLGWCVLFNWIRMCYSANLYFSRSSFESLYIFLYRKLACHASTRSTFTTLLLYCMFYAFTTIQR